MLTFKSMNFVYVLTLLPKTEESVGERATKQCISTAVHTLKSSILLQIKVTCLYTQVHYLCAMRKCFMLCVGKNADFMYMQASKNQILFLNFEKDK